MASSSPARRPRLSLLVLVLLLATLSSSTFVRASPERRRVEAPALPPAVVVPGAGSTRQEFRVAPTTAGGRPGDGESKKGSAARRPVRERRGRGGGSGAWAFSAMLPRGFVPPSGSSACHNDMPATAADALFFACSGAGTP